MSNEQNLISISSESLEQQYLEIVLSINNPFSQLNVSQNKSTKAFTLE